MLGRPLTIPPRFLLIVLLICIVYWVVAAKTEFSPLIPYSTFDQRVGECAAIWTILCSGYVGMMMFRRRPHPEHGRTWPTAMVPVLAGLWESICLARGHWADFFHSTLASLPSWRTITLLMTLTPLAMGLMAAAFLLILAWNWRRLHRPGTCSVCGYDLRGNTSHRCPECGLQLGGDEDKESYRYVSCPEALLFETAAERDAALREAGRQTRKSWQGRVLLAPAVLGVICMIVSGWFDRYETNPALRHGGGLGTVSTGVLLLLVSAHMAARFQRRTLRQILLERGIRVCLHCGQDLREITGETCPKCRRKAPLAHASSQSPPPSPPP
jgi:hypothetical protein